MGLLKTSKVKNVQANGTWQLKDGSKTFYKHEVSFDNGDTGEYSSIMQDQTKFVVGQETEYEFIDGKFPKSGIDALLTELTSIGIKLGTAPMLPVNVPSANGFGKAISNNKSRMGNLFANPDTVVPNIVLTGLSMICLVNGVGPVFIILGVNALNGLAPFNPFAPSLNALSVLVICEKSSLIKSFNFAAFSFGNLTFLP